MQALSQLSYNPNSPRRYQSYLWQRRRMIGITRFAVNPKIPPAGAFSQNSGSSLFLPATSSLSLCFTSQIHDRPKQEGPPFGSPFASFTAVCSSALKARLTTRSLGSHARFDIRQGAIDTGQDTLLAHQRHHGVGNDRGIGPDRYYSAAIRASIYASARSIRARTRSLPTSAITASIAGD